MNNQVTSLAFGQLGTGALSLNGNITAPMITALADKITVEGTLTAVSGTVLISSATVTTIGTTAVIRADAAVDGNGGTITVWSDWDTDFRGILTAKGGTDSGNGGFIEVSGKSVNLLGTVNTMAVNGQAGTFWLDPDDIIVDASGLPPTGYTGITTYVSSTALVDYLNTNGNYLLTARNTIEVKETIGLNHSWIGGHRLTLQAGSKITLIKSIVANGLGSSVVLEITGAGGEIVLNGTDSDFKIKANNIDFKVGQTGTSKITSKGTILHLDASGGGALAVSYDGLLPTRTAGAGNVFQFDAVGSFTANHIYANSTNVVYDSGLYYSGALLNSSGIRSTEGIGFGVTASDYSVGVKAGVAAPTFTGPTVTRSNVNLAITSSTYALSKAANDGFTVASLTIGKNAIVTAQNGESFNGNLYFTAVRGSLNLSGDFTLTSDTISFDSTINVIRAPDAVGDNLILRPRQWISLSAMNSLPFNVTIDLGSTASLQLNDAVFTSTKDITLIRNGNNPNQISTAFSYVNSKFAVKNFTVINNYTGNLTVPTITNSTYSWLESKVKATSKSQKFMVTGNITFNSSYSLSASFTTEFAASQNIIMTNLVEFSGNYRLTASSGTISSNGLSSLKFGGGNVTINSASTINLTATGEMSLGGTITSVGNIGVTAGSLSLSSNVISRGGDVTIDLGNGVYTNKGYSWNSSGKNVSIAYGGANITGGTMAFLLTKDSVSGVFNQTLRSSSAEIINALDEAIATESPIYSLFFVNVGSSTDNTNSESRYFTMDKIGRIGILRNQTDVSDIAKFTGSNPILDLEAYNLDVYFSDVNYTSKNIGVKAKNIFFEGKNTFENLTVIAQGIVRETETNRIPASITTNGSIEVEAGDVISLAGKNNFKIITGLKAKNRLAVNTVDFVLSTTDEITGAPIIFTGETFTLLTTVKSNSNGNKLIANKKITITLKKLDENGNETGGEIHSNDGVKWQSTDNQNLAVTFGFKDTSGVIFDLGTGSFTQTILNPTGTRSKPFAAYAGTTIPKDNNYQYLNITRINNDYNYFSPSEVLAGTTTLGPLPVGLKPTNVAINGLDLSSTTNLVIRTSVVLNGNVILGTRNELSFANDVTVNQGTTVNGNLILTAGKSLTVNSGGTKATQFTGGMVTITGTGGFRINLNGDFKQDADSSAFTAGSDLVQIYSQGASAVSFLNLNNAMNVNFNSATTELLYWSNTSVIYQNYEFTESKFPFSSLSSTGRDVYLNNITLSKDIEISGRDNNVTVNVAKKGTSLYPMLRIKTLKGKVTIIGDLGEYIDQPNFNVTTTSGNVSVENFGLYSDSSLTINSGGTVNLRNSSNSSTIQITKSTETTVENFKFNGGVLKIVSSGVVTLDTMSSEGGSGRLDISAQSVVTRNAINTGGASIKIDTTGNISLSNINSGGASLVLASSDGTIVGTNLIVGGVHFRAAGSVSLQGGFGSVSGRGSSVDIVNSSAGTILGQISTDNNGPTLVGSFIIPSQNPNELPRTVRYPPTNN
ncbi:MAG: hypothetical protein QM523_04195 [Candidatus Pacebacteria bacterium]|nr:hypothetical protein [Candidatus Paceibacterota bacterium]